MTSVGKMRKNKGSNYERQISKKMSKWSGQRVLRTLSSGAGGARAEHETRMTGDLFFPIGSNNSFTYELKNHASTRIQHVINNNGDIPEFWEQATTDCRRLSEWGYSPMLIFHISREADYVLVPWTKWLQMKLRELELPCEVQETWYVNERTKRKYSFETLLTTLSAITQLVPEELFEHYQDLNWDRANVQKEVPEDTPDKVVENMLENINDLTGDD
ncbi:hypothetical protein GPK34_00580 [Secundilactobacillus kimchicus]|uniref:putative PDDEXK endonuclease n=1 Tax=Secundilactobacillus kimchicus TaxID=528209 RepID=UPI001C02E6D8|nr:hypothetical protein [Secundilactobacillus kimchicus]MBT9670533.1 hypothetical protein [Secundilactobacillus kimchicus]